MDKVSAVILAGGRGERLSVLAEENSKPALHFAGKYRIIDFTINNCVNSNIRNIAVLTQYQPLSLTEHIGIGSAWGLDSPERGMRVLQPSPTGDKGGGWYTGTANAVYQNLRYIEAPDPDLILVLSGDHIYKMDYSWMVKFHREKRAEVTLAYTHLPDGDLKDFGTVIVDPQEQVTGFEEKIEQPQSKNISMGVYLFNRDILQQWLAKDARLKSSNHDFGHNVIPRMVKERVRVFGYDFTGYWRDAGTVQAYWQSNMDMLGMLPTGYLSDSGWPLRTNEIEQPPAIISQTASVADSLISNGCVIEGRVEHSVLSPGVIVSEGASVKDSIILVNSTIGSHCIIDRSIIDEQVIIEAGCRVGFGDDMRPNKKEPDTLNTGITLVGKNARIPPGVTIGRNCVVRCRVTEDDFMTSEVESGETIENKHG